MKKSKYIYFGEEVEGYNIPVLNEREARAGAGILFLFAIIGFFNAYLLHDFRYTQVFVTFFMFDFFIRIFINPKYAPSLILGRFFVSNQTPEYVGATQKRFAWSIGFVLSIIMFILIVVLEYMSPIKIIICAICLSLLFFEAAFSICIGCKIYNLISKDKAQHCPGGACEIKRKEAIQKISKLQGTILLIALTIIIAFTTIQLQETQSFQESEIMKCGAGKCGSGK